MMNNVYFHNKKNFIGNIYIIQTKQFNIIFILFLFSPVTPNLPDTSYIRNFHNSLLNQLKSITKTKSNINLTFSSLKSSFSFNQESVASIEMTNKKINNSFECISRAIKTLITVTEEAQIHQKELNSTFEEYQKHIINVRDNETPDNIKAEGEALKLFINKLVEFNNESNSLIMCCNSIINAGIKNFIKELNDTIEHFDLIQVEKASNEYDGLDELIEQLTKEVADEEKNKCDEEIKVNN